MQFIDILNSIVNLKAFGNNFIEMELASYIIIIASYIAISIPIEILAS